MASDISKIKLGPCKVTFDSGASGTPIVFESTKGGVVLNYEERTRETTIDQYGETPVKELITGRIASVDVPFAEYDLEKLAAIIPGSKLTKGTGDKLRLDVDASKVIDLLSVAKELTIQPLAADATANDAVILYKAAPRTNLTYTYSYDGELVTNCTFKAYPNDDGLLIAFGDKTASAV